MEANKSLQTVIKKRNRELNGNELIRSFAVISGCALLSVGISVGTKFFVEGERDRVYAASEIETAETSAQADGTDSDTSLSTDIAEIVSGALTMNSEGTLVRRIGTSCERVMVGQRVKRVEGHAQTLNISSSVETSVNSLDQAVAEQAQSAKMMSDTDYNTLQRIVEAEAGTEDIKGRVLVANVIMNRVKSEGFPDTVTDVVWDQSNGVAQFSPTLDGRIYDVTVSEETKEAVKQALEGVDYSEGALFFIEKKAASKENVQWFEKELKFLFKHGVHEFYTYPESSEDTDSSSKQEGTAEQDNASEDENVVQMVKNG